MTRNPSIPILGLDHARYADARLCALLTTTELGALVRLIQFGWYEDPPCTLPNAPAALAQIAGLAEGVWEQSENRLLAALGCSAVDLRDGTPGFLLTHALRVYEATAKQQAAHVEQRRRASLARWGRPPSAGLDAAGMRPDSGRNAAASDRGSDAASGVFSRARGREIAIRSKSQINQERFVDGADEVSGSQIAGAIFDGLEAAAAAKVREWHRAQAREILTKAFARWAAQGLIVDQSGRQKVSFARDIATIVEYAHVTACAAEIAVNRADARIADADKEPVKSIVGYLIVTLGARRGGRPLSPQIFEQHIVDRWAQLERRLFDAEKVKAAAMGAANRFDDARKRLSPPPNPHPHAPHGNVAGGGA